ncbi:MAG TPA: response regulator [Candidatus Sulfomarinibacteraceae bacterium]|nr:response regulator [Candidatus Sulfomarinibacteraceae bacterium]
MGKVLVIDNDRFMLEVIEAVLELAGRPTVSATSGNEGIEHFRTQQEDIDLVILDMRLSTATEGAETLRALRAIDPGIKVIIASAYSQSEVEEFLADEQGDAVLRKPYNMEQLLVTIEELNIGQPEAAPP